MKIHASGEDYLEAVLMYRKWYALLILPDTWLELLHIPFQLKYIAADL